MAYRCIGRNIALPLTGEMSGRCFQGTNLNSPGRADAEGSVVRCLWQEIRNLLPGSRRAKLCLFYGYICISRISIANYEGQVCLAHKQTFSFLLIPSRYDTAIQIILRLGDADMVMNTDYSEAYRTLLIIGAGGLGHVVAETAQMSGQYTRIAFLDDNPTPDKERFYNIIGATKQAPEFAKEFIYAIPAFGSNEKRYELMQFLRECGYRIPRIIHPTAFISPTVSIGEGTIIRPMAAISREVEIGECCLINLGAMIDHRCRIGRCTHIPIGCVVRNEVSIPPMSSFEPNSIIQ